MWRHFSRRESRRSLSTRPPVCSVRAVADDVVLVVDRLDRRRRSAGTARPARRWTCERHRQLVGDRQRRRRARSARSRRRAARRSPSRSALGLVVVEVVAALERGEARASRGSRRPTSGRCRRSRAGRAARACSGRAPCGASSSRQRRRVRPGLGPERGDRLVVLDGAGARAASPTPPAWSRTRAGAARARPSRRTSSREVRSRGVGALVEELQPARGHQVQQQRRARRSTSTTRFLPIRRTPVDRAPVERARAAGRTSSAR